MSDKSRIIDSAGIIIVTEGRRLSWRAKWFICYYKYGFSETIAVRGRAHLQCLKIAGPECTQKLYAGRNCSQAPELISCRLHCVLLRNNRLTFGFIANYLATSYVQRLADSSCCPLAENLQSYLRLFTNVPVVGINSLKKEGHSQLSTFQEFLFTTQRQ